MSLLQKSSVLKRFHSEMSSKDTNISEKEDDQDV